MAGTHGRVADFQVQNGFGRVRRRQALNAAGRPLLNLGAEGRQAFLNQGFDGFGQHQAHQLVRRVVAAGAFAGEDVEAYCDAPRLVLRQFVLQQALVDGAKLLHGKAAVVDVAAFAGRGLLEAKRIDQLCENRIGQLNPVQQRCAFRVEQAAVVGRQAEGGVALVNDAGQVLQGLVVAGGGLRKRLAGLLAPPHLLAHALPKADVGVGVVTHGQQVAVFGVEDEQQAVEQHQGGVAHCRQIGLRRGPRDGAGEVREDLLKNNLRQILGDAPLEIAALLQGAFVQVAAGGVAVGEGAAVEEQGEQLQGVAAFVRACLEQAIVVAGQAQRRRQVDFQKLVGHRPRPLPVQPPLGAVGEDSPTQAAVGQVVRPAQVAEHLRRGC